MSGEQEKIIKLYSSWLAFISTDGSVRETCTGKWVGREDPKATNEVFPLELQNINHSLDFNLSKPGWVTPGQPGFKGGAIIIDVWGVDVTWAAVATAITRIFRRNKPLHFEVKPLGYPTNRALFTTESIDEADLILKARSVKIGNGILYFQPWKLDTTKLQPALMTDKGRIRIWGIPLSAWNDEIFQRIGGYCKKTLTVDAKTKRKTNISFAHIKVKTKSINQIPHHMILSIGEDTFDLVLDGVGILKAILSCR